MNISGDGDTIISPDTPHYAYRDGGVWRATWMPGRDLTTSQATTAMVLAATVGSDPPPEDKLWQFVEGWAAELGLTAAEAIGACRKAPEEQK